MPQPQFCPDSETEAVSGLNDLWRRGKCTAISDHPIIVSSEPDSVIASLRGLDEIIEVDVRNTVLVTRAGARIEDCRQAAASVGLWCPALRWLPKNCTIGAAIAANHGRRSRRYGCMADYVLGLTFGCPAVGLVHHGGKVMKNATGYNLSALVAGSRGGLAVIFEVIIRLVPLPRHRSVFVFTIDDERSIAETLRTLTLSPRMTDDSGPMAGRLSEPAVEVWTDFQQGPLVFCIESEGADESIDTVTARLSLEQAIPMLRWSDWPPTIGTAAASKLRTGANPASIGRDLGAIMGLAKTRPIHGSMLVELTGGAVEISMQQSQPGIMADLERGLGLAARSIPLQQAQTALKSAFDPLGQLISSLP